MKELLDVNEKQAVMGLLANHPLQSLLRSCKQFEVCMPHLKFSPEEVFLAIVLRLEQLRDDPDEAPSTIRYMWDDMVCKYRERPGDIPDKEVQLAVCEVMCSLLLCLNSQDDADSIEWAGLVGSQLAEKYHDYQNVMNPMQNELWRIDNAEEKLTAWVTAFMESDTSITETIDRLLAEVNDPALAEVRNVQENEKAFPLDSTQCIILYSHLLDQGVAALDANDSTLAEFISNITPFTPKTVKKVIGRIKKKSGDYTGKIVQDAIKVANIIKPLKPKVAQDILDTYAP